MLVLVAHNGFTYELEANSETGVEKVKAALENLTGISVDEQILTYEGNRLDGNKTFLDYGLSEELLLEGRKIFLYNRCLLQQDSPAPQPETLQPLSTDYPSLQSIPAQLNAELSECSYFNVIQELAMYEQHFCFRVTKARAYLSVCSEYCRISEKLISQQEVQAQAIDSAQENVDKHYAYISDMYEDFHKMYISKIDDHDHLLHTFVSELERLSNIDTHGAVRDAGLDKLEDLLPKQKLLQWYNQCKGMHTQFKPKVAELSSLFTSLKSSVDALFMTVPSVDLIKLSEQLQTNQKYQEELSSIIQTFENDFMNVKDLYSEIIHFQKMDSRSRLDSKILDRYTALSTVNEIHVKVHLPRMEDCLKLLERFSKHCLACKNAMSRCVHSQMQSVAALQNHIRNSRNKLSAYKEVGQNIETLYSHLKLIYHIPKAYYVSLAEVVRRKSFAEVFTLHAQRFAEAMASMRQQEESTRQNFQQNNEYLLPPEVISGLSLDSSPPFCEVHVSEDIYSGIEIKTSDMQDSQHAVPAHPSSKDVERAFMSSLDKFNKGEGDPFLLKMENASLKTQLASLAVKGNAINADNKESVQKHTKDTEAKFALDNAISAKDNLISTLVAEVSTKSKQISQYEADIVKLEENLSNMQLLQEKQESKTSLDLRGVAAATPVRGGSVLSKCVTGDFKVQDIALFIEGDAGYFEAVNDNCPNHFLSAESVALARTQKNEKYIIGQIVHMEEKVFSGGEAEPSKKSLKFGDIYCILTICLVT